MAGYEKLSVPNPEPPNAEPLNPKPQRGLIGGIRWLFDAEVFNFIQQGFVTDIEDLGCLAAVPAGFFKDVGYDFLFNAVQRLFADFLQR